MIQCRARPQSRDGQGSGRLVHYASKPLSSASAWAINAKKFMEFGSLFDARPRSKSWRLK